MGVFEPYLDQFSQSVNLVDFLVNMGVTALLTILLRIFYIRVGNSVSNRSRFANNFLLLGLTTMLIITIVKSSIALSLGLVGALSIVRFRAAIKDPEELTYLFLTIGIGLAAGANQPIVAILAFVFITGLLYLNKKITGGLSFRKDDNMYLNVSTDKDDLTIITDILTRHLSFVELKRVDKTAAGLEVSFVVKAESVDTIEAVKKEIAALSDATTFSMIDQPDLVV
ncbi:MAG: DUF4956 domain-containing protein [Bacteroidetes bacterium]|nr:DUF4956 domain-containing protein [Bacteroidota bacterium]MCB0845371.1 DUF4956 domain-containing protein [Bacteroidota bacterium]